MSMALRGRCFSYDSLGDFSLDPAVSSPSPYTHKEEIAVLEVGRRNVLLSSTTSKTHHALQVSRSTPFPLTKKGENRRAWKGRVYFSY